MPANSSQYESLSPPGNDVPSVLSQIWSLITIWRLLVAFLLIGNIKNIPLIWHMRIVNAFRFCLRTQRPKVPVTHEQLFRPLITTTHAPLMEIDFNLHKTNSSYFSDIDIARTHLVCTLFSTGIEHMRGGTAAITGAKRPIFGLALGAVSCSFKRELKPYESYELWTRVLSWDEKWIYIVTHFVRKGAVMPKKYTLYPQQNSGDEDEIKRRDSTSSVDSMDGNEAVVATALSKCVFKQGRRTISPAFMLKQSGLLPTKSLDDVLATDVEPISIDSCSSSDSGIDVGDSKEESDLERIERERQRGMRVAFSLTNQPQNALEMEFTAESEALGRHTDGTGITGVVSTLAQLAHLKRKQIL
ncbi:uncharacterized protein LY89DRAFT_591482 [Mollisia scopiformis]|uniref:Capsule polysaccharide biosynthesis protein n=1 Tax=Mollisia scopiformis TaxID=149040 RepID=A0A194X012_MOLSC|nr:uncharacterized protein LY89DRAFT_591482 [Mollisia scopiformis]KUJ13536.1 hypothetical protein LY89DRAFT_591482 [Mollisia scopiformis]